MGVFSFFKKKGTDGYQGYRGIKRTGPGVLAVARQAVYDHLMTIASEGGMEEADVAPRVTQCVAQFAAWPEAMSITFLLRDLDPEDFYHA